MKGRSYKTRPLKQLTHQIHIDDAALECSIDFLILGLFDTPKNFEMNRWLLEMFDKITPEKYYTIR